MEQNPISVAQQAADIVEKRTTFDRFLAKLDLLGMMNRFQIKLWARNNIEWNDLPKLSNYRFNSTSIAECELSQFQFETIFSKISAKQFASQMIILDSSAEESNNLIANEFRRRAAAGIEILMPGSDQSTGYLDINHATHNLSISSSDPEIWPNLQKGLFKQALDLASEDERMVIFSLGSCMSFHKLQKVTKFLESFASSPKINIKNWLKNSDRLSDYDDLKDTRVNEIFSDIQQFYDSTEKMLRKSAQTPAHGKSMLAYNGRMHQSIEQLKNDSEEMARVLVEEQNNKKRDRVLAFQARKAFEPILEVASEWMGWFRTLYQHRNEAVELTSVEAGLGSIQSDSVRFFRSYSAGLTERALLMGLMAEAHCVATMLMNPSSLHRENVMTMLGRDQFGSGLSADSTIAEAVGNIPRVADCPGLIELCELQVAAIGAEKPNFPSISNGGQSADRALAQRFLAYVYTYDRWDQPVEPSSSAEGYREHTWRRLYRRFGLFGHLFL
jgi:ElaB/YqjD/DUF883 family membrane-anchored ribosome-binding protein